MSKWTKVEDAMPEDEAQCVVWCEGRAIEATFFAPDAWDMPRVQDSTKNLGITMWILTPDEELR